MLFGLAWVEGWRNLVTASAETIRKRLRAFDFQRLFVEDLGWDHKSQALGIVIDERELALELFAHKRGFGVLKCPPIDGTIPDHKTRMKIDREVTKGIREHMIVYVDATQHEQMWQWTRKDPGLPIRSRETRFSIEQHGDLLIQRLRELAFHLDEEEGVSIIVATGRVRAAFDVERVTKRFYDHFKKEHASFLESVDGVEDSSDREWYASVMLNRLMFIYFIQRKGFLDGDQNYLRNGLKRCQREYGTDRFYSFYRSFLLRLFHEGLGSIERNAELDSLLGEIPYLNGGLFDIHELEKPERYGNRIQITDKAFESIFDYFDEYQWSLDERPLRADNEINPDVLGYIFEKYINQKQMGAYYTKEDITEYIGMNTVLPYLLDTARAKYKVAFENASGSTVWDLLKGDPDRYIYPAVSLGAELPLPEAIASGIILPTPSESIGDEFLRVQELRSSWNKTAPAEFAHPMETWREVVARRKRYMKLKDKLKGGEIGDINDLISLNIDIRQFAQDVIEQCEEPALLRALWYAIENITILDPTCGSGAFLFAALGILEPLYEACLERMEAFVEDLDRSDEKHRPEKYSDFRSVLSRIAAHPNRRYFIFKSIILNNLFGVDIMEEAVEICKLRLFLKLAAQVEPDPNLENLGIEPLPDVDFNIQAGNTLVGFTTYNEVEVAILGDEQGKLDLFGEAERISMKAADLQLAFDAFRQRQIEGDGSVPTEHKLVLQEKLMALREELNRYLASDYGVDTANQSAYSMWLHAHQPFHWFVEFYSILLRGGFDVIIGNPPYVSAKKVRKIYEVKNLRLAKCPDIYAWILERSHALLRTAGRTGMIVPLSLGFSSGCDICRRFLFSGYSHNWYSSFGRIPSALFSFDVRVRNTIHLAHKSSRGSGAYTTRLHRWFGSSRPTIFTLLEYAQFQPELWDFRVPKLNTQELVVAFERLLAEKARAKDLMVPSNSDHSLLHYKKTAYNWLTFCRKMPPCYDANGDSVPHTKFGNLFFSDEETRQLAMLLANGKIMVAFWFAVGDDFDVTRWNFGEFPIDLLSLSSSQRSSLLDLLSPLEEAMDNAIQFKLNAGRRVGNYNLAKCRDVTDSIDQIFAEVLDLHPVWEDLELYYAQTVRTDFSDDGDE